MIHFFAVTTNRFGVLARVASIVGAAGINIDSAAAYPIAESDLAIIHLRVVANLQQAERLRRKLLRLVDVVEVRTAEEQSKLSVDLGTLMSVKALSEAAAVLGTR